MKTDIKLEKFFELLEQGSPIRFSTDHFEENTAKDEDLVELKPHALSLTQDPARPTLLLKDEGGNLTLPVQVHPVEAGLTLNQSHKTNVFSPHRVTQLLLESLDIAIEKCIFVEIRGAKQFVRLYFSNHPSHGSMKVPADEAISLCLYLGVKLFATPDFVAKSRILNADVNKIAAGMNLHPATWLKPHDFIQ